MFVPQRLISPRSPGWPQTHDPPTSAALVLGLQMCTAIPGFIINIFLCYHFVVCSSFKKAILTLIM